MDDWEFFVRNGKNVPAGTARKPRKYQFQPVRGDRPAPVSRADAALGRRARRQRLCEFDVAAALADVGLEDNWELQFFGLHPRQSAPS